jgi:hypothetical protein
MPSTVTFKLDDVTDLILTTLRALPEFSGVSIFDGPPIGQDSPKRLIMVGDDGDPESDAISTFTQEWSNLSKTRKRETGEIPCAVIAWDGGTDMKAQRDAVSILLNSLSTAILALASDDLTLELNSGSARPVQNEKGAATVVPFSITYTTTL